MTGVRAHTCVCICTHECLRAHVRARERQAHEKGLTRRDCCRGVETAQHRRKDQELAEMEVHGEVCQVPAKPRHPLRDVATDAHGVCVRARRFSEMSEEIERASIELC